MNNRSSLTGICREFLTGYPRHFAILLVILLFEGVAATMAVVGLVPLADYMLDPSLQSPSRITRALLEILAPLGMAPGFWLFGLVFATSNLLKGLLDVVTRFSILRIKYAVIRGLFGDALGTFFRARWQFFSDADQGKLLNTLGKELANIGDTFGYLATQISVIVQLCIYLTVPLWLNAPMTFTAMGIALLLCSPLLLLQKISYRLGQANTETGNAIWQVLNEILSAAHLILGFGRQKQSVDRYLSTFDRHVHVTLRSQTLGAMSVLFQPLSILSGIIALGIAMRHGTPIAEMAALFWSLLRALPLVASLMSAKMNINNFLPSYEQLISLRNRAQELAEVDGDKPFTRLQTGVVFKDVAFAYAGRQQTLQDINLVIRKGKMTALVGESGSGKSTITDLLLGLQIPAHGEILLDGTPLNTWKLNSFREKVGYVPQDPLLFHTTIRENLLWSRPDASETALRDACRMANAESFVRSLPQGLDTIVGDRGMRLSGGQRQRIALARALLRNPELLILDEATSALDSESERLIQESIENLALDTTILVVAHRLSTIAHADMVYVLANGQVVEEGSYDHLSRLPDGFLSRMVAAQQTHQVGKRL